MPISSQADKDKLQHDLDRLYDWSLRWGMTFNCVKCHTLHLGANNPHFDYNLGCSALLSASLVDDLGLLRDTESPRSYYAHLKRAVHKAYGASCLLLRGLSSRSPVFMRLLLTCYILPIVEYASPIWFPCSVFWMNRVERIQRSFTKRINGFSSLTYDQRLELINIKKLSVRMKQSN
jgi:hypothetical protein